MIDPRTFLQSAILSARQAGVVAIQLQNGVANLGKDGEILSGDSERLKEKRKAKTVVDEIVQDILILGLSDFLKSEIFTIDAEEKTLMSKLYDNTESGYCLVLDPIDGTLEYIEGRDNYSICIGLFNNGKPCAALVYFPARDVAYYTDCNGAYVSDEFLSKGSKNAKKILRTGIDSPKSVYMNRRVPKHIADKISSSGFFVNYDDDDDIGAPDAILMAIEGKSFCYISHTRQIRDILLGVIISFMENGYGLDWQENDIHWPNGGRLAYGVFGCWPLPTAIWEILGTAPSTR